MMFRKKNKSIEEVLADGEDRIEATKASFEKSLDHLVGIVSQYKTVVSDPQVKESLQRALDLLSKYNKLEFENIIRCGELFPANWQVLSV